MLPRGIRNNNPGNIRSGDPWQGLSKEQTDGAFCQFGDPIDGLRALMKVLLSYYRKHGINTVQGLINRWAPPIENNTGAYVKSVADSLGVMPTEQIQVDKIGILIGLAQAIVAHENGRPAAGYAPYWYPSATYVIAAKRALA